MFHFAHSELNHSLPLPSEQKYWGIQLFELIKNKTTDDFQKKSENEICKYFFFVLIIIELNEIYLSVH